MVKIAVSLTVAIFYENPKNGQCSGHCGLKMASGERVKILYINMQDTTFSYNSPADVPV